MGLVYFVIRTIFRRQLFALSLARLQPYFYAGTMGLATLMMLYLGLLYGVPRRHPSVMDIPGTDFSFAASEPLFFVFGIAAVLAITGGLFFVIVAVGSLLFGKERDPAIDIPSLMHEKADVPPIHLQSMRGTFTLTMVFLGVFVVAYALNWYLLFRLWEIG